MYLMPDSVIVTGAAGFIGRHVCKELASKGFFVLGIGHGVWSAEDFSPWGVERWVSADVTVNALHELSAGYSPVAIFHCAGSGAVSASYKAPYCDYRRTVDSTANVLEYARLQKLRRPRVVLTSSAAVYGDQGDVDISETSVCSPISPYGFHKAMAEKLCDSYSRFFDVNVSVVRLFSVYGDGLRKQLLWDALGKLSINNFNFYGSGQELRDWIHVRDAAQLLILAGVQDQPAFEVYNGGHVHASTLEVLTKLFDFAKIQGSPSFNNQIHIGNPRRLTSNFQHARRQLKWEPLVSLDDGLNDYVRWYFSTNHCDFIA
jgi:UDP-glucose 4-epimerase